MTRIEMTVSFQSLDPDSSYIPDVYDELLTQAEIQGNINKVNGEILLVRTRESSFIGPFIYFSVNLQKKYVLKSYEFDDNLSGCSCYFIR